MGKTKRQTKIVPLSIIFIISILVLIIVTQFQRQFSTLHTNNNLKVDDSHKLFISNKLSFSTKIPPTYTIEERHTSVSLKNQDGEIIISRITTNFTNIRDYLHDLSTVNKISLINQQTISQEGLDIIKAEVKYSPESEESKHSYFIYIDGFVYTISSFSDGLKEDLDVLAQSFLYIPKTRVYKSPRLHFSLEVPLEYQIEENALGISIQNPTGSKIFLTTSGTDYEKLEDYVNYLEDINNFTFTSKDYVTINSYPALKALYGKRLNYYISPGDWNMYILFTDTPQAYEVLESIAKTFKYIPK